jgi:hypothetical protein
VANRKRIWASWKATSSNVSMLAMDRGGWADYDVTDALWAYSLQTSSRSWMKTSRLSHECQVRIKTKAALKVQQ